MFNWVRRLVRRNTRPLNEDFATRWSKRLSVAYALFAWNAFGMVLYMVFTGRADLPKYYGLKNEDKRTSSQQWADTLGIKKAHVIKISGFTKVGEYDINNESKNSPESQPEEFTAESSSI